MKTILLQILLQIILIGLNAVFASAEMAIVQMSDAKMALLASKGNKKAKRLMKLTETPSKFLATIQIAITLAGFLGSAFAADNFSGYLCDWVIGLGVPEAKRDIIDSVSVVVITLILSYLTLVFGELVPKRVAMKKAESMALGISGVILFISKLFAPIVFLLTASTNGVLRLMGIDPNANEESVTEEEIRMMVDEGSEKGTIDTEEKELIRNVFEFDDKSADEIATHRTEINLLWMDETPEQWEEIIHESRHKFFPVCKDTVDDIVGVLNAKDYFRIKDKNRDTILKEAVRPAYFVPETIKADVLFRNMKQKRQSFAIVLDEYGGMNGIVTITDILECIVGDFDEDTVAQPGEEPDILQIDENKWKFSGDVDIEEAEEILGFSLDCDECDTVGGYIISVLEAIPADGSKVKTETDKLEIEVTSVLDHRIEKAIITRKPQPEDDGDEDSEDK